MYAYAPVDRLFLEKIFFLSPSENDYLSCTTTTVRGREIVSFSTLRGFDRRRRRRFSHGIFF